MIKNGSNLQQNNELTDCHTKKGIKYQAPSLITIFLQMCKSRGLQKMLKLFYSN